MVEAFQNGLVRDPFFLLEELKKLLNRRLEFAFGPIAYFTQIPLAKITVGDPSRNLLNSADIGIPADKIDE